MKNSALFFGCLSVFILLSGGIATTKMSGRHRPKVEFKDLHDFPKFGDALSALLKDSKGNLYGTTALGGKHNAGAVYKLTNNHGSYNFRFLHSFDRDEDGQPVFNELILSHDTLYGETWAYGRGGNGTLFSMRTDGNKFVTLYAFTGGKDGKYPVGGLVMDSSGNLYGSTEFGGDFGYGSVFEFSPKTAKLTTLVSLDGTNTGEDPRFGLNMDQDGNLWGTSDGGSGYDGTVFELTPTGSGRWDFRVVHEFSGNDGKTPQRVMFGGNGNVFGTTAYGGSGNGGYGGGVLYELQKSNGYNEVVLYNFCTQQNCTDGEYPSDVRFNEAGHLLGVSGGGMNGVGALFEFAHTGSGWQERIVYNFTSIHSCGPSTDIIIDRKGHAFGGISCGNGGSRVYEISGIQ